MALDSAKTVAMADILIRACFFLLMVVLGYAVKKCGILTEEDGVALSRIVLNITLPAAILVSFRTFVFDWRFMLIPLVSLAANWLMLFAGYAMTKRRSEQDRIFYMLELPAYNIGNFTLPFVSSFLGATGVVASCLFDMGNAPMCLGLNFTMTAMMIGRTPDRSVARAVLSVFKKPSFTVYVIMLILAAFSLSLPDIVFDFAGMISPANAPMAMVMIGLMLEIRMDRTKLKDALSVNAIRLALAAAIAVLFFALAPFSYEVKKAVAITAFAPISSASPAFVAALKGDVELVGFASTISIIVSLILMPLMIVFL